MMSNKSLLMVYFVLKSECKNDQYVKCIGYCLINSPYNKQTGYCDGGCNPEYTYSYCDKGIFLKNYRTYMFLYYTFNIRFYLVKEVEGMHCIELFISLDEHVYIY